MPSLSGKTFVAMGEELAAYGFPGGHPFDRFRHVAFAQGLENADLLSEIVVTEPVRALPEDLYSFHTREYVSLVQEKSLTGQGYLDGGDTPAFLGVYEAAATVAGTALNLLERVLSTEHTNAFLPIGGLHHARRDSASGFCVFNDCGIVIEKLFQKGFRRVAYIDIDAHHGDGVYYSFEGNPHLIFADLHEGGIYPGTGSSTETGAGEAKGKKLNIPVPAGARDEVFFHEWQKIENFVDAQSPDFILLQCGCDSIAGDPITSLSFTFAAHQYAAERLKALAEKHCHGRLIAFGGGGYNKKNISIVWPKVVSALTSHADPLTT